MVWRRLAGIVVFAVLCAPAARAGVRVQTRTVPGGVELENRKLVVTVKAGAAGAVVRSKAKGVEGAEFELAVLDAGGKGGKIGGVQITKQGGGEAAVRFACGAAQAEIVLKGAEPFVEVRPLEGTSALESRARARYAILPDFFAHDVVYDPETQKSSKISVPAENFLLQLLEGGTTISVLVWKGALTDAKEAKKAKKVDAEIEEPKVELVAQGEGGKRRFSSSRVEFVKAQPIFLAVLAGPGIWHEEDIRGIPGAKGSEISWKRPFDAKWRADFVVGSFDKTQVKKTLEVAKEAGVPANYRDLWAKHFEANDPFKPIGSTGVSWQEAYSAKDGGFWGMRIQSRDFDLFDKKRRPDKYRNKVNGCYFDDDKTCLAPMAQFPVQCGVDGSKFNKFQKQRKTAGKEPLYPPHLYSKAIIYPMDQYKAAYKGDTRSTPPSQSTLMDVMRNTLGVGRCEYIMDLDGMGQRDWLADGREGVRIYGGKTRRLGICPLTSSINNIYGKAVKENRDFTDKEREQILVELEDRVMFAKTICKRNDEYRQWGRDFVAFCEKQAAKSAKVKPVADALARAARQIEAEMETKKGRFIVLEGGKKVKTTGEKCLAYWEKKTAELKEQCKNAKSAEDVKAIPLRNSGSINNFGDEIDWMVARLRRMVREIRHRAGSVDTSDPDVARFCAKVRRQCQAILRNKHARETWGGDD